MAVFLSNGHVAWQIPLPTDGRYVYGMYKPPPRWVVIVGKRGIEGWIPGVCGELRKPALKKIKKVSSAGICA